MRPHTLAGRLSVALATVAHAQFADLNTPPTCLDEGVQVITLCGTYQTGYGTLDGLTQSVVSAIPGSQSVALDYPANETPSYHNSVDTGVKNLNELVAYYLDACPKMKLVILGYSQGAQVSFNSLCGWPEDYFNFKSQPALATKYQDNILAFVAYGDPTHAYPTNYDLGNSTHNGIFPRLSSDCFFDKNQVASWCIHGDEWCDDCPPPTSADEKNPRGCNADIHLTYWDVYNEIALQHVVSKYNHPQRPIATATYTPSATATSATASISTSGATAATSSAMSSSGASRLQPWSSDLLKVLAL